MSKLLLSLLRGFRYLIIAVAINGGIWGLALYYLKNTSPTYTSSWAITLPGAGSSTNVNLPEIGGASSTIRSPFENRNGDPRENYKFIATSPTVLQKAAEALNIPLRELNRPRVSVVDNTTLITFEVEAESPEVAHQQSWAIHNAFESRLKELRLKEVSEQETGIASILNQARSKVDEAQLKLSQYKTQSGFVSFQQLEQLSMNIEGLRRQRVETLAQKRQVTAQLAQLSANLQLEPTETADAFSLSTDQLFQRQLLDYSQSTANLEMLSAKYGPNHPVVLRERSKQESAQAGMLARSQQLLGRPVNLSALSQLNIGSSQDGRSTRDLLFQEVMTNQVTQQGLDASVRELDRQIAQLEARLQELSLQGTTIESLSRDRQVAETVFSSTLAKIDIGKADLFGSYPQMQLITEPTLPVVPTSPKKNLVYLGAMAGSSLFTLALFLLYIRKVWQKTPKDPTVAEGAIAAEPSSHPEVARLPEAKPEVLKLREEN